MNEVPFSEPIILQLPGSGARRISGCREAIACLQTEWPEWARGRAWRRALTACREALERQVDEKTARRRIAKAANRAGVAMVTRRDDAAPRIQRAGNEIPSPAF